MSEKLLDVLKEEACKYASHYSRDYVEKIKTHVLPFSEHFKNLNFNRGFFENILFQEAKEKQISLLEQIKQLETVERELELFLDKQEV